jgi:hypothetical protein
MSNTLMLFFCVLLLAVLFDVASARRQSHRRQQQRQQQLPIRDDRLDPDRCYRLTLSHGQVLSPVRVLGGGDSASGPNLLGSWETFLTLRREDGGLTYVRTSAVRLVETL